MLERVERARRTATEEAKKANDDYLMETFGTTDRKEIAAIRDASKKLAADAEERKRAEMTEIDRHKADIKRAHLERDDWKTKYHNLEKRQAFSEQDVKLKSIASQSIAATSVEYATWQFAKHVSVLDDNALKTFGEPETKKWFADFAKKNPQHAPDPTDPKKPPTKKPVTTGVAPRGKPAPTRGARGAVDITGKTPRPGQPNSMNKAELRAYLKSKDLNTY